MQGMKEQQLRVEATQISRRPDYRKSAGMILTACRNFYTEPENEEAFRKWKAEKEGKAG